MIISLVDDDAAALSLSVQFGYHHHHQQTNLFPKRAAAAAAKAAKEREKTLLQSDDDDDDDDFLHETQKSSSSRVCVLCESPTTFDDLSFCLSKLFSIYKSEGGGGGIQKARCFFRAKVFFSNKNK